MYIGESDLIADSLSDITLNLTKNIQDELYPGHGVITHNLHDSIQSNVTAFNQSDLTAIIEAYTMVEYAPWVNDGHTLRNGEWWKDITSWKQDWKQRWRCIDDNYKS